MEQRELHHLLQQVADGSISSDEAEEKLRATPFTELGYAKIDNHRGIRRGISEIIYGEGKTPDQIVGIAQSMIDAGQERVLITRLGKKTAKAIEENLSFDYDVSSRVGVVGGLPENSTGNGTIVIAAAGTSDLAVAEEAAITAEFLGNKVVRLYDVGVAGIHRLLAHTKDIQHAQVVIAVAGMEGALPSVVAGIASCPVIAVPTSVGYGASFGGVAALLAMLNSCASGVSVVNIDNGFGAAYQASLINHASTEGSSSGVVVEDEQEESSGESTAASVKVPKPERVEAPYETHAEEAEEGRVGASDEKAEQEAEAVQEDTPGRSDDEAEKEESLPEEAKTTILIEPAVEETAELIEEPSYELPEDVFAPKHASPMSVDTSSEVDAPEKEHDAGQDRRAENDDSFSRNVQSNDLILDLRTNATRRSIYANLLGRLDPDTATAIQKKAENVGVPDQHHHNLAAMYATIDSLEVSDRVKTDLKSVYTILAGAEAQVHGADIDQVHFHEVGNAEAIRNVVGISLAIEALNPGRIIATPVQVGSGTIQCAHGTLAIPAPATAAILGLGIPIAEPRLEGELCTPTSAAVIAHFVNGFYGYA